VNRGAAQSELEEAAETNPIDKENSILVVKGDFEVIGAEEIFQLSVFHRVVRVSVMDEVMAGFKT